MFKALNGLLCADVPLRNYSLTELNNNNNNNTGIMFAVLSS